jgi:hypothetical protein
LIQDGHPLSQAVYREFQELSRLEIIKHLEKILPTIQDKYEPGSPMREDCVSWKTVDVD